MQTITTCSSAAYARSSPKSRPETTEGSRMATGLIILDGGMGDELRKKAPDRAWCVFASATGACCTQPY